MGSIPGWVWYLLAGIAYNLFGSLINPDAWPAFLAAWRRATLHRKMLVSLVMGFAILAWPVCLAMTLYRIGLVTWYVVLVRLAANKLARLKREGK